MRPNAIMDKGWCYELRSHRVYGLRLLRLLPPQLRARIAERHLRRPDQPGPAAEHVLQYLVSDILRDQKTDRLAKRPGAGEGAPNKRCVTVGQADFFYKSQYRQFCSPVMGAFAATAPQVLAASSTASSGHLWWKRRKSVSAMMPAEAGEGFRPILVIDEETLALAVLVPYSHSGDDEQAIGDWIEHGGSMPRHLATLAAGVPVESEAGVGASRERSNVGGACELVDAALRCRSLALLAVHPYDPDAMGLHLTLFGVEGVGPDRLVEEYGLDPADLADHRDAAAAKGVALYYLVGRTAEVFTQCSQNLFTKRPHDDPSGSADGADAPRPPLDRLFAEQFETLQATVAADGVPGASPRNGQIGHAAYVERRRGRVYILIPYYPGNAIHGHAAKLWTNRHASLVVSDDHSSLRRVTVSGASDFLSHRTVRRRFPVIALAVTHPEGDDGQTVNAPVYWFATRADEVVWETGTLARNELTAERPACSVNAGGDGRHTKKPKYFDAGAVAAYDMHLQHEREASPRGIDPAGSRRASWLEAVAPALVVREQRLVASATRSDVRDATSDGDRVLGD